MNKAKLKSYAPQARKDFIQMIRQRADLLGLTKRDITPARVEGEYAVIEGRPHPKSYAQFHKRIADKIKVEGLEPFVERIAYSWFNRFAALRFMEVNGFISHGFRVLSNRDANKNEPEILTQAAEIEFEGLDNALIVDLKLAGNKDAELYRLLLIAQCNELNRAMPFLFERINDETEILLPDNLLATDSVIRKMVGELSEDNWRDSVTEEPIVEVIGWLYQFYISEKKDEVIGKTVKSEDIPAATQLFTPNWIVKYMTQNSLGRLWLEANPHSQLAANMEFYIKPADENQTTNSNSNINPEEIKVLDPACGSGHILVEAYELLKAIYTERGYSSRDIPLLILEKNLFGLDIDERAAQMANFALLMKARRDDRRIFERLNQKSEKQIPNILTVPDSSQLPHTARGIAEMFFSRDASSANAAVPIRADGNFLFDEMQVQRSLVMSDSAAVAVGADSGASEQNVIDLLELFEQGKTLGSLIRIPHGFGAVVDKFEKVVETKLLSGNFYEQVAARELEPFVRAGRMLANKYDCVIANPPYMGGKGMNGELKSFAAKNFPDSKSDLFAMFIERAMEHIKPSGSAAFVTPFVWMFISSYEKFRKNLIEETPLSSLIQLEYNAFEPACVPVCTFTMKKNGNSKLKGEFIKLSDFKGHQNQAPRTLEAVNNPHCGWRFQASTADFEKIPGSPIAYWVSEKVREVFDNSKFISEFATTRKGMATGDNNKFVRVWTEVEFGKIGFEYSREQAKLSNKKWFPYANGGNFRRWFGNLEDIVNWEKDGYILQTEKHETGRIRAVNLNLDFIFHEGLFWSDITSSVSSARFMPKGFLFSSVASSLFSNGKNLFSLAYINSIVASTFLKILNPTLHFNPGDIASLPICKNVEIIEKQANEIADSLVAIARADWDSFETSWDFKRLPVADCGLRQDSASVEECWQNWKNLCDERIRRMQELETENNRLFIEAYGLEDELSPEVPLSQITLARADAEKDSRRLLSYFVGCLMGRYSLDQTNLIYADSAGKGFEASNYQTFPADDDGIVPVTDMEWFPQEAANRFADFIRAAFPIDSGKLIVDNEEKLSTINYQLSTNLRWIAEQLGGKSSETPIETVRRYFSTAFFKDHLQTYKKRPIYWLFSSGKQKAFECLVYLHRYNESTLPRMRHEYVLPLMSKLEAQIETLAGKSDAFGTRTGGLIDSADSTSEKSKLTKQKETLIKKQAELAAFDEKLRHYSDMRISLDLDDGVKVNYGKFGDLLAEVKQVATTKE